MAGRRQPTDVVEANGRKHMTKQEAAERRAGELSGPGDIKQLRAPAWLYEYLRPEFNTIARQLVELMPKLIIRADAETVAAYVTVHDQWVKAGKTLSVAVDAQDEAVALKWAGVQSKLFAQARALATDMGLTISARCQLVIPAKPPEAPQGNPFGMKVIEGGKAANG